MEIRGFVASVAVVLASLAQPACAWTADVANRDLFDNGVTTVLQWSRGDAGLPPRADLMNAGSSSLPPLSNRERYERLVDETARTYGLESALLHAVVHVESGYNPKAVSPQGAMGLMQLTADTARRYDVEDAFDPVQNLRGGAHYLRDLVDMFDNDLRLALAAYNAGEYAVIRNGYRMPRLKETVQYVGRVLKLYRHGGIGETR